MIGRREVANRLSKLMCVLLCGAAVPAFGGTINFDDVNAAAGDVVLNGLNPYHGFTWTNFSVYTTTPGFPGFNNGIVSPANAAYSGGEVFGATVTPVVGEIQSASPFNFVSAYVGAGYYDNLSLTVQGLLGGSLLFTRTVTVNTTGAQLTSFGFTGINELDFFASKTPQTTDPFLCGDFNCTQFTLDDLTFAPASTPVPLPSSFGLLALALALVAAQGTRRRTR
jgi:hypothetical protein